MIRGQSALRVVSMIALGSAHILSVSAGAVPAFMSKHLSTGRSTKGKSALACRASAKVWANKEVPEERIRVFLVRHGAGKVVFAVCSFRVKAVFVCVPCAFDVIQACECKV